MRGSQGENSINCLARHKIMLHYRLAMPQAGKNRQMLPWGARYDAETRTATINQKQKQQQNKGQTTDTTCDIRQVPPAQRLRRDRSTFVGDFPSVFPLFFFCMFFFFFGGNSNCRWADETMTIEMAMKLPMPVVAT